MALSYQRPIPTSKYRQKHQKIDVNADFHCEQYRLSHRTRKTCIFGLQNPIFHTEAPLPPTVFVCTWQRTSIIYSIHCIFFFYSIRLFSLALAFSLSHTLPSLLPHSLLLLLLLVIRSKRVCNFHSYYNPEKPTDKRRMFCQLISIGGKKKKLQKIQTPLPTSLISTTRSKPPPPREFSSTRAHLYDIHGSNIQFDLTYYNEKKKWRTLSYLRNTYMYYIYAYKPHTTDTQTHTHTNQLPIHECQRSETSILVCIFKIISTVCVMYDTRS